MHHHDVTDEVLEQAAFYALGTLDRAETEAFEAHVAEGCAVCAEELDAFSATVAQLAAAARPALPRPELRERVLAGASERVLRSGERSWEAGSVEGLSIQRLASVPEEARFVALVHLEAGRLYPGHWHTDIEELYVLAGSLRIDRHELEAGDLYAAPAGRVHDILSGAEGCTCLLVSPEFDEPLDASGRPEAEPEIHVARSAELPWQRGPWPGVGLRTLFADPGRGTVTALVRLEAGCGLPRHRHETAEQIYLLDGDARVGGHRLEPGDFYRIGADTVHEVTSTEGGCTFLLLASRPAVDL
jgi:anti-sigma factor ChrR (cupin superfamily)